MQQTLTRVRKILGALNPGAGVWPHRLRARRASHWKCFYLPTIFHARVILSIKYFFSQFAVNLYCFKHWNKWTQLHKFRKKILYLTLIFLSYFWSNVFSSVLGRDIPEPKLKRNLKKIIILGFWASISSVYVIALFKSIS